jgi:hypothetical protein
MDLFGLGYGDRISNGWRVHYLINKYSRDIECIPWQDLDGDWPVPANCMPSLATGWLEFANNLTDFASGCHCIAKSWSLPASGLLAPAKAWPANNTLIIIKLNNF